MKLIYFIISVFIVLSCNNQHSNKPQHIPTVEANKETDGCDSLKKLTLLIQQAIDIPELQQYYGVQKTLSQQTLVIVSNDFIRSDIDVYKLGNKVSVLSKENIARKGIKAFIEFKELQIISDTAKIKLSYPVQGLSCNAVFLYQTNTKGCDWKLLSKELYEYKAP